LFSTFSFYKLPQFKIERGTYSSSSKVFSAVKSTYFYNSNTPRKFSIVCKKVFYVINGPIGNVERNGLSPAIPVLDDDVTGSNKTLTGIPGAIAESNADNTGYVDNTGIVYSTVTGELATITVSNKLTFRSTGETPQLHLYFK
jgi:hypothetical protein